MVIRSVTTLASYTEREGRLGLMLTTTTQERWVNQRDELVRTSRIHPVAVPMIELAALTDGFEIPTLERRGTFVTWSHFAAVNHEIADHHMDDDGRVVAVAIQLRSPFLRDRVLTAHSRVAGVRVTDETFVDLDVWADDDLGTLITKGTATVALF